MPPVLSSLNSIMRAKAVQKSMFDRVQRTGDFILRKLAQKQCQTTSTPLRAPLIVGINGAQGSGKTTLVRGLVDFLTARNISTVGFSLDDLYLPYAEQLEVRKQNPSNPLLCFRGQPGTHDLSLGRSTLTSLLEGTEETRIPRYDKSLHSGYGDRVPLDEWPKAAPPVDVVLFEGWCLGFRSLNTGEFSEYLAGVHGNSVLYKYSRKYSDANLAQINTNLGEFEKTLYGLIDAWVYMRVADVDVVYRWRKEQEDAMAALGKPSLSDQQLEDFVERFMPLYEIALGKLDRKGFLASGLFEDYYTLRMHLDMDRNVVAWDHIL
ncbi:P-loop containing nucleoside triphosphate hydrolase protein [Kickxella alabastrina]|uniref:P-loop containing nucleoside triphosphate hydrolase protein n=1 Tax=Kickxella alabastrina TaxID=61397 RepID=UPI00221E5E0A|nr:P-loop containing nucleoside triphosphate hydrolase protein [Kickxella alabastrina]KAI7824937.1 P-loop containing nucleoside triphosphate hydrolase protein [Kickxella alabastrina]